jgi:TonB family protein
MNASDANQNPPRELKDELARFCLPQTNRDPDRKLAWTNSICILFLLIGITGWRRVADFIEPPPPVGDSAAVVIQPMAQPPATDENQKQEQTDADKTEAPQVVAVTLDTPAINFAVPTIGNLVVATALAKAPPAAPLKIAVRPMTVSSTGAGGERPQPPYPKIALESAQQGSVVLLMSVDDTGVIASVEIKESSGWPILDRATLDFVKRHWTIPPVSGTRLFEATITYKLTVN